MELRASYFSLSRLVPGFLWHIIFLFFLFPVWISFFFYIIFSTVKFLNIEACGQQGVSSIFLCKQLLCFYTSFWGLSLKLQPHLVEWRPHTFSGMLERCKHNTLIFLFQIHLQRKAYKLLQLSPSWWSVPRPMHLDESNHHSYSYLFPFPNLII